MPTKKKNTEIKKTDDTTNIEPGMMVEATKGDLGEEDVSKPKVTEVVQDQQGNVDKLVVQKGVIFKKTLEIPADRIQSIDQEDMEDERTAGKVIVDVSKNEAASLTSIGTEALESDQQSDILDKVEQEVPTAEGLRELEASKENIQEEQNSAQSTNDNTTIPPNEKPQHRSEDEKPQVDPDKKPNFILQVLGPGSWVAWQAMTPRLLLRMLLTVLQQATDISGCYYSPHLFIRLCNSRAPKSG